jgi:hypothetical protein
MKIRTDSGTTADRKNGGPERELVWFRPLNAGGAIAARWPHLANDGPTKGQNSRPPSWNISRAQGD